MRYLIIIAGLFTLGFSSGYTSLNNNNVILLDSTLNNDHIVISRYDRTLTFIINKDTNTIKCAPLDSSVLQPSFFVSDGENLKETKIERIGNYYYFAAVQVYELGNYDLYRYNVKSKKLSHFHFYGLLGVIDINKNLFINFNTRKNYLTVEDDKGTKALSCWDVYTTPIDNTPNVGLEKICEDDSYYHYFEDFLIGKITMKQMAKVLLTLN